MGLELQIVFNYTCLKAVTNYFFIIVLLIVHRNSGKPRKVTI